jgi:hypothetical protein
MAWLSVPVAPAKPKATKPFSASGVANPFGDSPAAPFSKPAAQPFKQSIEPLGLRPDMSPDPMVAETPISFLQSITLTQVLIVLSFTLIIALMFSTFFFVLKVGGVRLNGI